MVVDVLLSGIVWFQPQKGRLEIHLKMMFMKKAYWLIFSKLNYMYILFQRADEILEQDNFFELLHKFQSRRIDDQRCSFRVLERNDSLEGAGNTISKSPSSTLRLRRNGSHFANDIFN